MAKQHFTEATFEFLTELAANNDKSWWDRNRDRYVEVVREPALDFIDDFRPRLAKLSPHFTAESKTVGGSLMRPHRDIRFSKDKTPYKTNVGIQFRHTAGRDIHAPGFYLHIEPGASFVGVGMWHPEPAVARQIRQAINDDSPGWDKAVKGKSFTDAWSIDPDPDEVLKRVPKEFDADHPNAEALKMRSFVAGARIADSAIAAPGFDADLAARYRKAAAFTGFLCSAVGLPY
jgi:uncharacterized protein (TIGR02453 family)